MVKLTGWSALVVALLVATSCLAHLFSPFAQQLSLTILSCGLYQLSTKGCHNMKLVMKVFLESDEDII